MTSALGQILPTSPGAGVEQPAVSSRWRPSRTLVRASVTLGIDGLFVLIMVALTPNFATAGNFKALFQTLAEAGIVVAPQAMLMVSGQFDLSVDGVVNMSSVLVGEFMVLHMYWPLAVIAALGASGMIGLINGTCVTRLRINPLMTTLATWWIAQGIAYGVSGGLPSTNYPHGFVQLIYDIDIFGLGTPFWLMVVVVVGSAWILARSRLGFHLYAIGSSRDAARAHGVRVNRSIVIMFVATALASGVAGILYTSSFTASSPTAVAGLNLETIGGAVIGGTSLFGGIGSVGGAFFGLLFMGMLQNGCVVLGVNPYWEYTVLGVVLLAAVALDALAARRARLVVTT